uniref:Uncharacterized protein n=1 Tax=Cucumis melo TaxID=3656 RepID=A0A9I9DK35_CUCME
MGKTKSGKAQWKHDRGFDFLEQGGRREGSCEKFRATANKEDEEKVSCERFRATTNKEDTKRNIAMGYTFVREI